MTADWYRQLNHAVSLAHLIQDDPAMLAHLNVRKLARVVLWLAERVTEDVER